MDSIERTFQREGFLYIACNDRNAFFTSDAVRNYNLWSCQKVCDKYFTTSLRASIIIYYLLYTIIIYYYILLIIYYIIYYILIIYYIILLLYTPYYIPFIIYFLAAQSYYG